MTIRHWKHYSRFLFFREFDIPLKEIKAVMDNPVLERNQLLQMQRKMLGRQKKNVWNV